MLLFLRQNVISETKRGHFPSHSHFGFPDGRTGTWNRHGQQEQCTTVSQRKPYMQTQVEVCVLTKKSKSDLSTLLLLWLQDICPSSLNSMNLRVWDYTTLSSEHSLTDLKRHLMNRRVVGLRRMAVRYRLTQLLMIVSENKTQHIFPI